MRTSILALSLLATGALAQAPSTTHYPNKPVRVVVAVAPGGGIDTAVALDRPAGAQRREMAGQLDVLADGKKRQQIELLENVAGVIDPKAIAGAR